MAERDSKGRFAKGNTISRQGGKAAMAKRSPEERHEFAHVGFEALRKKWGWSRRKLHAWLYDPLGYRSGGSE